MTLAVGPVRLYRRRRSNGTVTTVYRHPGCTINHRRASGASSCAARAQRSARQHPVYRQNGHGDWWRWDGYRWVPAPEHDARALTGSPLWSGA